MLPPLLDVESEQARDLVYGSGGGQRHVLGGFGFELLTGEA
jgi:hypothetical protein